MNILVVSENFTEGGLETHIHSYYMQLRKEHHFTFALGCFKSMLEFDPEDLHIGFHFSGGISTADFVEDVEGLVKLIRDRQIDVIHVHPFYSIFPAVMAGQLTGVPVACTHHGTYSFAFPVRINEALLLYYAYTELVDCVFSVSNAGKMALETRAHVPNAVFMPNAIDTRLYRRHMVADNRRWAAISRLGGDLGKAAALKKLFEILPSLPIDTVDIYGDGSQRQALEEYAKELGLEDRVRFMGFQSDLYERLNGNYNGIIGSDRVALEGLTMGYPVLELGYERVCGLLYGELLQQAKDNNFVANILPSLSSGAIAAQLEQVYAHPERFDFRQEMVETFDIQTIAKAYVKQLSVLTGLPHANMVTWFDEVKAQSNQLESFYSSQAVLWSMRRCIEPYTIDRNMKDLFLLGGNQADLKSEMEQFRSDFRNETGQFRSDFRNEIGQLQLDFKNRIGQFQSHLMDQAQFLEQVQAKASGLEETQRQFQSDLLEQMQTEALNAEEAQRQFQMRLLEQAQALEQLREQLEYHRKVLAPLLWIRKALSRIKWTIKGRFAQK